jgi:hypothetical protein
MSTLPPIGGLEAGDYTLTLTIDLATASDHSGIPQPRARDSPSISHRAAIV